jgi:hypothetical protein
MTQTIAPVATQDAEIRWSNGDVNTATFALIPQDWQDKDMSQHPADDSVFYWLDAYEWISFGYGFQADNWTVISN